MPLIQGKGQQSLIISADYDVTRDDYQRLLVISAGTLVTLTFREDPRLLSGIFYVDLRNMGPGTVAFKDASGNTLSPPPPLPGYCWRIKATSPWGWQFEILASTVLESLPPGGSTGQVLAKRSGSNYDVEWQDAPTPGTAASWGSITGTLSDQTDLQAALSSLGGINVAPPSSGWSWLNQGTSTVSTSAGFPFFNVVGTGTDQIRGYVRPKTGNFTLTIGVQMRLDTPGGLGWGILLGDGTKYISLNWMDFTISSNGYSLRLQKWNSPTSYNSLYTSINGASLVWLTGTIWYRVVADSTNYTWYYSFDKLNWIQFDQHGRGDFLGTLSEVGVGGHTVTGGLVSLVSWEEA